MEFGYTPSELAVQIESRQFAQTEIAPIVPLLETDFYLRQTLFEKMGKKGLFSLGKEAQALALAIQEVSKVDAGMGIAMSVTNMVAETINQYGTPKQKEKYLPRLKEGVASFALTERNAGSDPKQLLTTAKVSKVNDQSLWINGDKQFITNGDISKVLIVFAKTVGLEKDGITAFLIDRETPGFHVSKVESKLGLLSINLVALNFDNCQVDKEQILGKVGEGLKIAFHSLDKGRLGVAAQAIGIAESAYENALEYSQTRQQFGKFLCDNQAIAFKLADMHVKLSAAKLLLSKACWLCDRQMPFTLAASEAKLYASEVANEITSEALQIYGGYGYVKDFPMEKFFRDARVTTLYEGTSEIQRIVISRHLLKGS